MTPTARSRLQEEFPRTSSYSRLPSTSILLEVAAGRYDLDGAGLLAAAQAALAAPDRIVDVEVGARIAA